MADNQQDNNPINPEEEQNIDDDFETIGEGEGEGNDDIEYLDDDIINQMDQLADQNEEAIEHTDEEEKHISESDESFTVEDMSCGAFREHGDHIYTLAQHPTKHNLILSGGGDDRVLVWDMLTDDKDKQTLFEIKDGFKDSIEYIKFNHDGKYLLVTGQGNPIRIYKVKEGTDASQFEFKIEMETGDDITFITWHQKSNFFLTGGNDMMIWMFNALTGEFMTYTGHEDIVNNAIFTPNGKKIVSISNDCSIKVWDPITTKWIRTIKEDKSFHQYSITSINMWNETLITGDSEGYVYISQVKTGEWVGPITKCDETIEQILSWSSSQVWGSIDGSVRIIDIGTQSVGINVCLGF